MAGPGRQQEGGGNTEATLFVTLIVIGLAAFVIWTFARPAILYPAFAMDAMSIWLIEHTRGIGEAGTAVKNFVHSIFDGRRDPWDGVEFSEFVQVRQAVGMQTRIYIAGIITILAAVVLYKMRGEGYKRRFSLTGGKHGMSFSAYQAERWRTASASASFEPDGRHKDILPARTPLEWMRDNKISYENMELDEEAAEKAFAKQLGDRWHSLKRANLIQQTIAILIGLHLLDRKEALAEREKINIAWSGGQDGTKAMNELVAKYLGSGMQPKDAKLVEAIEEVMSKHAFVHTGMHALLSKARANSGVLASSDFLWLRWNDRTLHYVLNNVGRRAFHTEGAGVVCHFFAERAMGGPIPEPHVAQAIDGIIGYLEDQGIMSLSEFFKSSGK